jgi:hypothetical protein
MMMCSVVKTKEESRIHFEPLNIQIWQQEWLTFLTALLTSREVYRIPGQEPFVLVQGGICFQDSSGPFITVPLLPTTKDRVSI